MRTATTRPLFSFNLLEKLISEISCHRYSIILQIFQDLESWQNLDLTLTLMQTCQAALDIFYFTCLTSVIVVVVWSCASSWYFVPVVLGGSTVTRRNDAWEFQEIFNHVWEQWQLDVGKKAIHLWTMCGSQLGLKVYQSILFRAWFQRTTDVRKDQCFKWFKDFIF